jgi:hypothetical protein
MHIEILNIFAMGKSNKCVRKDGQRGVVPASVLSVLEKVDKGDSTLLSKEEVLAFMAGKTPAEAGSSDNSESSEVVETTEQGNPDTKGVKYLRKRDEQLASEQKNVLLNDWFDEVKKRPLALKRKFIYLDGDVLDVFSELRKSTGVAATQCINSILIDWIEENRESIISIINARARNRILDI